MKSIKTKMMLFVGLVVGFTLILVTVLNSLTGKELIGDESDKTMVNAIDKEINSIQGQLQQVETMLESIARVVGATYKDMELSEYESMLSQIILDNDVVLGSGIWFKEYAYDPNEKYVGPYVYKDGDKVITTYDYSNADYDYLTQEYYTLTLNNFEPHITDPYYDETSGLVMASSSIGIRGDNGQYIGCITVDIELSTIESIVNNIHVGETGSAVLTTSKGTYLAGIADKNLILNEEKTIDKDENESLATAAAAAFKQSSGEGEYKIGRDNYYLYYGEIPETGWKLFVSVAESEIQTGIRKMNKRSVIVGTFFVIVCLGVVFILINNITKDIKKVCELAGSLSEGDFTVNKLNIVGRGEMAMMGQALDRMYDANKTMLAGIQTQAEAIAGASEKLEKSAVELSREFDEIETQMSTINESMMTCSAATEEMSAGIDEVDSNVNRLADATDETLKRASEIKSVAETVEKQSSESAKKAAVLSEKFENELAVSIENAAVVDNISQLARVIASIAEQINLLSLNASIEAARAGDQGRGFAVVAGEIGKLAGETSQAVSNIQSTIDEVQNAFGDMSGSAKAILSFVQGTVTSDYATFVEVAGRYGDDAEYFANSARSMSGMAGGVRDTMRDLTIAVRNVAESAQLTAEASGSIFETIKQAGENAESIKEMSEQELTIADGLNTEVSRFKM